jgi:hypothetical protein
MAFLGEAAQGKSCALQKGYRFPTEKDPEVIKRRPNAWQGITLEGR